MLIDVWMFTPFIALLLLAGLRSMPAPPFEAAMVDGASKWFIFKNLTIPMLMPFITIAAVFRIIDSIRQFDIIFGLTKGGPRRYAHEFSRYRRIPARLPIPEWLTALQSCW